MSFRIFFLAFLTSNVILLLGCDSEESVSSQVAVKVNDTEITFTELNEYIKRVPVKAQDQTQQDEIKKSVLNSLVDQKLLLESAKKAEVHRTTEVLSAVDIAKNKIIVDAYLNKVLSGSFRPSSNEVEDFYNENTLLFNKRKRFIYDQYTLAVSNEDVELLIGKIKLLDNSNQLKPFLEAQDFKYGLTREYRTTNQLPKQLVKAMSILEEGDIGFFKVLDGLVVIGLHDIENIPVSLEEAKSSVSSALVQQNRAKAIQMMVKSLKDTATIEFNPVFEELMKKDAE